MSKFSMKLAFFVLLFLTKLAIIKAFCSSSLPATTSYNCGGNNVLTPASFTTWNSGSKELTIIADILVDSVCTTTKPASLVIVGITPASAGTEKKIVHWAYTTGTTYRFQTEDATGAITQTTSSATASSGLAAGIWLTFYASINLGTGMISTGNVLPGFTNIYGNTKTVPYGSDWVFDDTFRIYICSSTAGVAFAACTVKTLTFWYTYAASTFRTPYIWGITPILVGHYLFQDQTQSFVTDQARTVGYAALGSSTSLIQDPSGSPSWSTTEPGVTFTAIYHYVTIPTFTLQAASGTHSGSVTLNFWVKLNSMIAGYILRYSSSDYSTNRFSISVANTGNVSLQVGTSTIVSTTSLSVSTWTQVTANIVLTTYSANHLNKMTLYQDAVLVASAYNENVGTIAFTASDKVTLGGPTSSFFGSIKSLSIYSPGTLSINNPSYCESTTKTWTCEVDIGMTDPPICISCSSDTILYRQQCIACRTGSYLSSGQSCLSCPTNCATCNSSTNCLTCNAGYNLYNSLCVTCPSTTFLLQDRCIDCSSTCATCSDASTCLTCKSGYALQGTQCVPCPSNAFLDGTTCTSCPEECATCTSLTNCLSCSSGYVLNSTMSCAVPEGGIESKEKETYKILMVVSIIEVIVVVVLALEIFRRWRNASKRRKREEVKKPRIELKPKPINLFNT